MRCACAMRLIPPRDTVIERSQTATDIFRGPRSGIAQLIR